MVFKKFLRENNMVLKYKLSCILISLLFLSSCYQRNDLAPVVEANWHDYNSNAKQHEVIHGETLYAIAFRYDKDYRQLADINHLNSPYTLRVGQVVKLDGGYTPPNPINQARNIPIINYKKSEPRHASTTNPINNNISGWVWPIPGRVVTAYSPSQGKKGIDIAGRKGDKIHAASSGVVAYSGSGLSGYGNLIIIKHNNQYLTAYGNNHRNLVRVGQKISKGQAIAEIGVVDRRYWGVHFEIRKAGVPVNPLSYLKSS